MLDGNASYQDYAIGGEEPGGGDERLPLGSAMLAIAVLSLLGWAVVLLPIIAAL
jgi:hypothetical protein